MIMLGFIATVVVLFVAVLAYEADDLGNRLRHHQTSLLGWLVGGNWPAKIGAMLLVIGLGALMRYALLHVEVGAESKLATGMLISAALAWVAYGLRAHPRRRALHLAFAGTSGGVAYMTAYAAYGLFGFISSLSGLSLLFLVSGAVGLFALRSGALSMAMLSMIGAYTAPAFALSAPGPTVALGYYVAVSILSLLVVSIRGWRPLIHLSFLFTLGGSLFFGWTAGYWRPEYFNEVQPLLLALAALHLAMPIAERRAEAGKWLKRVDSLYALLLPLTAGLLMAVIAPQPRPALAMGLTYLAILWGAAAVVERARVTEATRHAAVAILFLIIAGAIAVKDFSIYLAFMLAGAGFLTATARLSDWQRVASFAHFAVLTAGCLQLMDAIFHPAVGTPFLNYWVLELVIASAILGWTAWLAVRRANGFAMPTVYLAAATLGFLVLGEIRRLNIAYAAQLLHVAAMLGTLLWVAAAKPDSTRQLPFAAGLALVGITTVRAASDPGFALHLVLLMLGIAWAVTYARALQHRHGQERLAMCTLIALPYLTVPWVSGLEPHPAPGNAYFAATVFAGAILAAMASAVRTKWSSADSLHPALTLTALFVSIILAASLLTHISRDSWNIAFELVALANLVWIAYLTRDGERAALIQLLGLVSGVLILQAMLLRVLGPAGTMTILDALDMDYPAVLSLMWACIGAVLVGWSGSTQSRSAWTAGSCIMAMSAVKLLILDLGSLGELSNILALIAAGGVFLGVAWWVPVPPSGRQLESNKFDAPASA